MGLYDYLAPWMSGRPTLRARVTIPAGPPAEQASPATVFHKPDQATRYQRADDPSYCCDQCEDLTAVITAHKHGHASREQLDRAVASHGCNRSPIGVIR
jgi:hypothetical protein